MYMSHQIFGTVFYSAELAFMHKSCVYMHKTFVARANTGHTRQNMKEKISFQIIHKNLTLKALTLFKERKVSD